MPSRFTVPTLSPIRQRDQTDRDRGENGTDRDRETETEEDVTPARVVSDKNALN